MLKALLHSSELITLRGVRKKDGRHPTEQDLERIPDGAIVYSPSKILWIGPTCEIPAKYKKVKSKNLKHQHCIVPGIIDCHTHLVFGGDRALEFALRSAGASYQEIAEAGGGIQTTVESTRLASQKELENLAFARLKESFAFGVRGIEIKSGYGLSPSDEIKILNVIKNLRHKLPEMKIATTFMGAHAFPKDQSRDQYMRAILEEMIPEVAKKKLAEFCDVFLDQGYFTREETLEIFQCARKHGLKLKLHGDELTNQDGASLAVKEDAQSVDHLLKVSEEGIRTLSRSPSTVAVLLPGTAFYLKEVYAPARKLIDAGACVAVATDFNPGTCMTLSLPSVLTIAALYMKMTSAELLASVTFNAAKALGWEKKRGALDIGVEPFFSVLPFKKWEDYYYRFAWAPL